MVVGIDRWSDHSLDEAFRGIREDRDEARAEHAEMKTAINELRAEMVARFTAQENDAKATAASLAADARRERAETRRATLQLIGVLGAAAIAAAGGIIIALATGGVG